MNLPEDQGVDKLQKRIDDLERTLKVSNGLIADLKGERTKNEKSEKLLYVESFIKIIGTIFTTLAGTAFLFYILGFLIVNMYLSTLGIRDFSLGRITYLTSGIVFFLAHLAPFLIVTFIYWLTYSGVRRELKFSRRLIVDFIITSLLAFGIMTLFLNFITRLSNSMLPALPEIINYSIMAAWFIGLLCIGILAGVKKSILVIFLVSCGIAGIPTALILWTKDIYPNINPAFGGGKPIPVVLIVQNSSIDILSSTGIQFSGNNSSVIGLLDDTGESLTVVLDNGNLARVDKSLITNIVYYQSTNIEVSQTTPTPNPMPSLLTQPP